MLAVNLNLNLDLKPKPKPKPSPTVDSLLLWCVPCFILLLCHRFVFLRVHNTYAMFYDLRIATDLCFFGFTTHTSCFMLMLFHRFVFLRVHNAYAMYVLRIATDLCSFGFTTHTSYFMIYLLPQICVPSRSQRIRHVLC